MGAVLAIAGATFVGQGLGYIPGSFMTGDPFWAVAGAALGIAALAMLRGEVQRQR